MTHAVPLIPLWVSSDVKDKATGLTIRTWTKKMMVSALPPLQTMVQLRSAQGPGEGGMLCVEQHFLDEATGNYFCFTSLEDEFDYKADGWTLGDYWELMQDAADAAAEKPSHWTEVPEYPVADWQYEVSQDDTRLGYADWVAHKREGEEGEAE